MDDPLPYPSAPPLSQEGNHAPPTYLTLAVVSTVVLAVTSLLFVWVGVIAWTRSSKAARLFATNDVAAATAAARSARRWALSGFGVAAASVVLAVALVASGLLSGTR